MKVNKSHDIFNKASRDRRKPNGNIFVATGKTYNSLKKKKKLKSVF